MNKTTQKTMFSSDNSNWETPPDLFNIVRDIFNMSVDVAASSENFLCTWYLGEEDNSLQEKDWKEMVIEKYRMIKSEIEYVGENNRFWCNPPYGRQIIKWVEAAIYQFAIHGNETILLLPARTDTKWFKKVIKNCGIAFFLEGRLKFRLNGKELDPAPFPSALFYIGQQTKNGSINYKPRFQELVSKCTLVV